jgi:hypothetical protein
MAERKMHLADTYIHKGIRYGPGKNVVVPDDFPKELRARRVGHQATFKPGTSGSGFSLEDAPENGISAEGTFNLTQGGKMPGETEEEFQERAREDQGILDEADAEARKGAAKAVTEANKPKASKKDES